MDGCVLMTSVSNQVSQWEETGDKDPCCQAIDEFYMLKWRKGRWRAARMIRKGWYRMGWWCNSLNAKQYVKKKRFRTSGLPKLHCPRFKTRKHAGEFITYFDTNQTRSQLIWRKRCGCIRLQFHCSAVHVPSRQGEKMWAYEFILNHQMPETWSTYKAESSVIKTIIYFFPEIYSTRSFPPHLHF